MLPLGKPGNQFAAMQAIGAAVVRLAGFFGIGLWLAFRPLQTEAAGDGDRVDKDQRVLIHKNTKNRSHLEKFYCATIKDVETEEEFTVAWDEITPWNA